jgi:hypothetical protein
MYCTSTIDADAEREAEAIERLCDLLGNPVPMTGLQRERLMSIEAAERGLPKLKRTAYNRPGAVAAFRRLNERFARGDMSPPRIAWSTRSEKERRAQQRRARMNLLARLGCMIGRGPVDFTMAKRITGAAERSLYKAVKSGEVASLRIYGRRYFEVADLHRYLQRRLAHRVAGRWMPAVSNPTGSMDHQQMVIP